MTDYTELKRLAEACPKTDPMRLVEYHGAWRLRNAAGTVLAVHRDRSFPNFMAQNEAYARFVEVANPATILALLAENERLLTLLARMVDQHVPLTELEGVPGWDRAVELIEVVAERNSLKLEVENLRTVQRASFSASGQIKAAASELGFNPAQEEGALEFLIGLASSAAAAVDLPDPYAVIGDYAACGGERVAWEPAYADNITDQMCKKTPVYDIACLLAAGLKVKP